MLASSRMLAKNEIFSQWACDLARIDGKNCTAIVFGGFGFKERQMQKHTALYERFNFKIVPIFSTVKQLTKPSIGETRCRMLAEDLQCIREPIVIHAISGSVWTAINILFYANKEWRDKYVKAIVFDSCPPKMDIYAFGGWFAFLLKKNYMKPYLAHLFHPYVWYAGITKEVKQRLAAKMFGPTSVIPRSANLLFIHGDSDPVLDNDYLAEFIADVRTHKHPDASVNEKIFPTSRHAMSVVDYKDEYKLVHLTQLLSTVPDWIDRQSQHNATNCTDTLSSKL